MKARILMTVCFTFIIFLTNSLVSEAQESSYSTKVENGKVISQTKYVMGNYEMRVKESESKYTYDEKEGLLKKEVSVWNQKYKKNDKGKYYPDYSESNWTPKYCIFYERNSTKNTVSVTILLWNKKKNAYDDPVETMIFQLNDSNYNNYLAFLKVNENNEGINDMAYDKKLFSKLAE